MAVQPIPSNLGAGDPWARDIDRRLKQMEQLYQKLSQESTNSFRALNTTLGSSEVRYHEIQVAEPFAEYPELPDEGTTLIGNFSPPEGFNWARLQLNLSASANAFLGADSLVSVSMEVSTSVTGDLVASRTTKLFVPANESITMPLYFDVRLPVVADDTISIHAYTWATVEIPEDLNNRILATGYLTYTKN